MVSEMFLMFGAIYWSEQYSLSTDWGLEFPRLQVLYGTGLREEGWMDLQTVHALSQS